MADKQIMGVIAIILILGLLGVYYFLPFNELEFSVNPGNYNFSLDNSSDTLQFYPNMRYSDSNISYHIYNCSLKKTQDMKDAFKILENLTVLNFYPVSSNEEILITCNDTKRFNKGMFVAGEGGIPEAVHSGKYNVILKGKILLIEESNCERPNVAIHELLHALGFQHSSNPNNLMYNYTKCSQVIGDEIPALINEIYSIESLPDLAFENVSAYIHGRKLDLNISVRNIGIADSKDSVIIISTDNKEVSEFEVNELKIGGGKMITMTNIWLNKISISQINLQIDSNDLELSKENNFVSLEIKK